MLHLFPAEDLLPVPALAVVPMTPAEKFGFVALTVLGIAAAGWFAARSVTTWLIEAGAWSS